MILVDTAVWVDPLRVDDATLAALGEDPVSAEWGTAFRPTWAGG